MRIRIIVGVSMLPILPVVLFFAQDWVLAVVIALLSVMSVYELLARFIPKKRLVIYALIFSACVPFWSYVREKLPERFEVLPLAGAVLFLMLLFGEAVLDYKRVTFAQICVVFTTAASVPFLFSSLIRLMALPEGKHIIMLPFVAALLGDTCAYFAGITWGKHKLSDVSPKKTIEGSVGGLAGVLMGMIVYGLLEQYVFHNAVSYTLLLLYGLLGSLAGQLGDLSMSLIKREFQIKDFGNLLPGHGGMLDRFDSLLFAAPVLEVLIILLPAITVL